MNHMQQTPTGGEDQRMENTFFELYILAQIILADPEFYAQNADILLGRVTLDIDERRRWDVDVYFPKLRELRDAGKILEAMDVHRALHEVLGRASEMSDLYSLIFKSAKENMPKAVD